jgi:hypothetical protein
MEVSGHTFKSGRDDILSVILQLIVWTVAELDGVTAIGVSSRRVLDGRGHVARVAR